MIKIVFFLIAAVACADPLHCDLSKYQPIDGMSAQVSAETLTVSWRGEHDRELRLFFGIQNGAPEIRELAIRNKAAAWSILATRLTPDFRLVSGLRRITNQQLDPLAGLGVKITPEILERDKWEAFWDAPLNLPGEEPAHNNNTPPHDGVLNQPGLPRDPKEI